MKKSATYQIFTVCMFSVLFACLQSLKIRNIRKQINQRLTILWLLVAKELEFDLQSLISEVWRSEILFGGLKMEPTTQTSQQVLS